MFMVILYIHLLSLWQLEPTSLVQALINSQFEVSAFQKDLEITNNIAVKTNCASY